MAKLGRVAASIERAVDRAAYVAQHTALANAIGLAMRGWHRVLGPAPVATRAEEERLRQRFRALCAEDLANVDRGEYPRALLFQIPYLAYLRRLPEALLELPKMLARARAGAYRDLPASVPLDRYPSYYQRTFHWQSDGWLSDRSARLYDVSVEVLFTGTADVMRRMAIPPVVERARRDPEIRVLDLACGTGRFLHQLRRAAPRARLAGVDLSSFYVARAAQLLAGGAEIQVADAAATPYPDASFDVVTSVFLFHELPPEARRAVAKEAFRLLVPGGRFVICDSAQLGDSPDLAVFLGTFPELYHEPFYKGYLRDDLEATLREAGFARTRCSPALLSKIVVGDKQPG
jgi:ubiquinone/menaquinone biosynthesis C-methylase UbiE